MTTKTTNRRSKATGRRAGPAKLAPPRERPTFPRKRLFRHLDAARSRAVVWLAAPAGYGKTTLIVSYLAARNIKPLWYSLDERDEDPAAFFFYLRQATMRRAPRKRETLSLLAPEYLPGLPVFARNFFDAVFERLRPPAALVFDDYHTLGSAAVLHELLPKIFASVPAGVSIFVLSRSTPPPSFLRLQARQSMNVLDAETIALTLDEVRGIARLHPRHKLTSRTLATLYSSIQGWAAAWTLLFERSRPGELVAADIPSGARETLFDYILAELFEQAPPDAQDLLLRTAVLPQVSATIADALTGRTRGDEMLADLERRNYLITRLSGTDALYQFHPLFREFLLVRLRRALSVGERRRLQQKAARLLTERGEYDTAAGLLIRIADWDALITLIGSEAPSLVAHGRIATLQDWIGALPQARRDKPWLEYWFAVCCLPYDPAEASRLFGQAYEAFKEVGDGRGLYCAFAGAVHPIMMQSGNYADVDRWLKELTWLERRFPLQQHPDLEPQVGYSVLTFLSVVGTNGLETSRWAERMETLSQSDACDARSKLLLLIGLNVHYYWSGKIEQARLARERLAKGLSSARGDPIVRLQCCLALSQSSIWVGDLEVGTAWAEAGVRLGAQTGVRALEASIIGHSFYVAQQAQDAGGAQRALVRFEKALVPGNRVDEAQHDCMAACLAWQRSDLASALGCAERVVTACEQVRLRLMAAYARLVLAQILVELGELERAARLDASAREYAQRADNPALLALSDQTEAWIALRQGDTNGCAVALARSFAFARRNRCFTYMTWNSRVAGPLCEFALAHDIEAGQARRLIRNWHLAPSESDMYERNWPWPVKVRTFGRFEVLVDDEPLAFARKSQRKPLELLKALIALGGRGVREDRIGEALWPEAEADRASQALNVTQHRLRKLIGEAAIVRRDRSLSLDPRRCWVDVWVLERELTALGKACREPDLPALVRGIDRVFDLYRGPFLRGSGDSPWLLSAREALHAKFLRRLGAVAEVFREAGRHDLACRCFEKGLEVDSLVESFYRGLMQVHIAQGHAADAVATYSRCRRMLATSFGLEPSRDTEALAQQVMRRPAAPLVDGAAPSKPRRRASVHSH